MPVTREQALAELQRRGVPVGDIKPKVSREAAMAELKRRGVDIPEDKWYQHPIMSGVTGFTKGVEDVTHGILQPLLESGYLGENIKKSSEQVGNKRQLDFQEEYRRNPNSAMVGNILGNTAISLPLAAGSGGGAALSKAPGFLKYLQTVLGGAASGAATGAAHYTNPGESRLGNALTGGIAGGALGTLGAGVSGARNAASAVKQAYPAKKVTEKILTDRSNIRNTYKNAYESLFNEAEKGGIHNLKVPKINENAIKSNTTTREFEALDSFLKRPSLQNAHKAQSDLGKTIRRLQKTHEGVGLNTSQKDALESAIKAQKKIRGSMFDAFSKGGKKELANEYGKLTRGYAKEVLPYTKSKPINTYLKGELTDKDFLKSLAGNKKFAKQLGEKYPELNTRKKVDSYSNKLMGAGATAGVIEALHLMGMF